MEPNTKLQGEKISPNVEAKEEEEKQAVEEAEGNKAKGEEKQAIREVEGKKAKGELRFSLSTEKRYDEKSISEEELKKKRERLMHRRGTQYEYLIDGLGEKTKAKVDKNSKSAADDLPKDEITTLSSNKLLEAENPKLKKESKQTEKELEIIEKKLEEDAKIK